MPTEAPATVSRSITFAVVAFLAAAPSASAQKPAPELSPFQSAKAEHLLERRLPCLGCHVVDGRGGRIGPNLTSVHLRLTGDQILEKMRKPGALMPRIPMPPEWRRLVAAYLSAPREQAVTPPAPPAASPARSAAPARTESAAMGGARLYSRHCAACHGTEGRGDGWNAPYLPVRPTAHADSSALSLRSDDALFDIIHAGGFVYGRSARMPPFGSLLTDEEIRALVRHLRSLCRCTGPGWSTEAPPGRAGSGT